VKLTGELSMSGRPEVVIPVIDAEANEVGYASVLIVLSTGKAASLSNSRSVKGSERRRGAWIDTQREPCTSCSTQVWDPN